MTDQTDVDTLLRAPVAVGMILAARAAGDVAAILADPVAATALAGAVTAELTPWSQPTALHQWLVTGGPALRALVAELIQDPRIAWWHQPLDRDRQLFLTETPFDDVDWTPAPTANPSWETYAQRPASCQISSTELTTDPGEAVRSGLHAELAAGCSDWDPEYPLMIARAAAADSARVYEITGPADWHDLARRYPSPTAYEGPDQNLLSCSGIDHGPGPFWEAVAADWDAVHLSFLGWITGAFVPFASDGFTTTMWSWLSERTLWFRDVFTSHEQLADLLEAPEFPLIPAIPAPPALGRNALLTGRSLPR